MPAISFNDLSLVELVNVARECLSVQMTSKTGRHIMSIGGYYPGQNYVLTIGNRFVDRDMLMRYHWGLGVGHIHSHGLVSAPYTLTCNNRAQA